MSDQECAREIGSALYKEFLAERDEILRHKYAESEKAGYDVGFERALLDRIVGSSPCSPFRERLGVLARSHRKGALR